MRIHQSILSHVFERPPGTGSLTHGRCESLLSFTALLPLVQLLMPEVHREVQARRAFQVQVSPIVATFVTISGCPASAPEDTPPIELRGGTNMLESSMQGDPPEIFWY